MLRPVIIMAILLCLAASVTGSITYTEDSKTECQDGVCRAEYYSGTAYGYEDRTWKPISSLRSFKSTSLVCDVQEDDTYAVDCIDFNMTSITFKVTIKDGMTALSQVPVKSYDKTGTLIGDVGLIDSKYITKDGLTVRTAWDYTKELHIGAESTKISVANSSRNYILMDAHTRSIAPTTNYGSENANYISFPNVWDENTYMIKILNTIIPAENKLVNASLWFAGSTNYLDAGDIMEVTQYWVNMTLWTDCGNNWAENCPTWNKRPLINECISMEPKFNLSQNNPGNLQWIQFGMTEIYNFSDNLGDNNFTLYWKGELVAGTYNTGDADRLITQEGGGFAPYIELWYEEDLGGAGDPCDAPASGTWYVPSGCTITKTELADYLQSGEEVHLLAGDGSVSIE